MGARLGGLEGDEEGARVGSSLRVGARAGAAVKPPIALDQNVVSSTTAELGAGVGRKVEFAKPGCYLYI